MNTEGRASYELTIEELVRKYEPEGTGQVIARDLNDSAYIVDDSVQTRLAFYFSWLAEICQHSEHAALRAMAQCVSDLPADDPLIVLTRTILPKASQYFRFGPPVMDMPDAPDPQSVYGFAWSQHSCREGVIHFLAGVALDLEEAIERSRLEMSRKRRLRRRARSFGLRIAKRQMPESNMAPLILAEGEYDVLAGRTSELVANARDLDELEGFLECFKTEQHGRDTKALPDFWRNWKTWTFDQGFDEDER